jgi:diaminohydroxyphosphoribosylaminopyrimidine deaminase/5-amino-6-(5-phosphoribosylamino)uracil reductase
VEALHGAGVRRVVFAVQDPTPAGGGGALLRHRGLDVQEGLLGPEAARVNEEWLTRARTGRPHVHWKFAATLDGRSAAPDGSSRWITSAAARADVHLLRGRVDAIVVGVGTVLRDDPELTARDGNGAPLARQPLRVVVDSTGRTPSGSRVLRPPGQAWIATAAEAGAGEGGVSPSGVLEALARRGVVAVLLEGGPRLAGSFLAAGLVDRVTTYLAPALLGAGAPALDRPGVTSIGDTLRLDVDETRMIGPDVKVSGRPQIGG